MRHDRGSQHTRQRITASQHRNQSREGTIESKDSGVTRLKTRQQGVWKIVRLGDIRNITGYDNDHNEMNRLYG